MAKDALPDHVMEQLLSRINQETYSSARKVEILFSSKGFFSAHQASRMLYAYPNPADKLNAMLVLEARLCRMSCSEARDILGAFSIQNDRIKALEVIKRYLMDSQTQEGKENILSCFPFENDKSCAANVLKTVQSDQADLTPAGGHQGYAALGGLYTQSRPLVPHLYGPVSEQRKHLPAQGKIELPVEAKPGVLPSMYTGHPSYAYPQGRDYALDRRYPGNEACKTDMLYATSLAECTAKNREEPGYLGGGSSLGMHQGGPAPTGFQSDRSHVH